MREVLGYNLKNFFDTVDPNCDEAEITYAGDRYEVWKISDQLFSKMCSMTEKDFREIAGSNAWMRSSDGCLPQAYKKCNFTINGKDMIGWKYKPWQEENREYNNTDNYSSLSEYLREHIGASMPRNICACAVDLAKYNDITMGELFTKYEG